MLAIGLALLVASVPDNSLPSGSKASSVAPQSLGPVYQQRITIGVSGFVPRWSWPTRWRVAKPIGIWKGR